MNLKLVHYAILGLGVVVMVCSSVATSAPQYAPVAHAVAGVAGSVSATLGVLCPAAVPEQVAK